MNTEIVTNNNDTLLILKKLEELQTTITDLTDTVEELRIKINDLELGSVSISDYEY